MAVRRLQAKVRYAPIGFELLAEEFTLSELQSLYERILQRPLDKRNFRKEILGMELLRDTERRPRATPSRTLPLRPSRIRTTEQAGLQLRDLGITP
jgi:8-oxo-dGTP diphosphatase